MDLENWTYAKVELMIKWNHFGLCNGFEGGLFIQLEKAESLNTE